MADLTKGYDVQKITVSTSSIGLTLPAEASNENSKPDLAFITVETDSIRFRYDGTAPTSTDGHEVVLGGDFQISGYENIRNLKMIRSGTVDATVQVTLERRI